MILSLCKEASLHYKYKIETSSKLFELQNIYAGIDERIIFMVN